MPQNANGRVTSASTICIRRLLLRTRLNTGYDPKFSKTLAERTGLEPATPGVTGRYSNQLNYRSVAWWVLTGSNRRHSPCKGDALPAELSTPSRENRRLRTTPGHPGRAASLLHPSGLFQDGISEPLPP